MGRERTINIQLAMQCAGCSLAKTYTLLLGLVGDEPRKYFGGLRLGNGWTGQWRWRRDPCLI